jgi:Glycogen recognition site of AMP-activated protein kinase
MVKINFDDGLHHSTVQVAGEFSSWAPIDLNHEQGNQFGLELNELEAGRQYMYKYIVDGEWKLSGKEGERVVDDGKGNLNHVLTGGRFTALEEAGNVEPEPRLYKDVVPEVEKASDVQESHPAMAINSSLIDHNVNQVVADSGLDTFQSRNSEKTPKVNDGIGYHQIISPLGNVPDTKEAPVAKEPIPEASGSVPVSLDSVPAGSDKAAIAEEPIPATTDKSLDQDSSIRAGGSAAVPNILGGSSAVQPSGLKSEMPKIVPETGTVNQTAKAVHDQVPNTKEPVQGLGQQPASDRERYAAAGVGNSGTKGTLPSPIRTTSAGQVPAGPRSPARVPVGRGNGSSQPESQFKTLDPKTQPEQSVEQNQQYFGEPGPAVASEPSPSIPQVPVEGARASAAETQARVESQNKAGQPRTSESSHGHSASEDFKVHTLRGQPPKKKKGFFKRIFS